ncbi:ABC transporter ATP-binding protein [Bacillus sp. FJAT-52991]|uniref:ABC transporter transmembrane domain-containing protein n=1 Tax=Bacillus kandeliae TaxID=3129297 RepID=A0ABZ2N2S9_9BACI
MFSVLRKLSWFFKEYRWRYTVAVVFLIIASVLVIIPPKIVGLVIDDIHMATLTSTALWKYISILLGTTALSYGLTYVWMHLLFGGAFILERKLRLNLMTHFMKMTPTFYERNRTGDLMARATNDLKAVSDTTGFGVLTLVDSTIYMLLILFTMSVSISWKLTLAAVLPLPIMALLMTMYGEKIHQRFTEAQDAFGDMNDRVLETVGGVRVIRAYVQERADEQRFQQMTNDVYQKNIDVAKIDALFEPTIKIFVGLSYLIGLGYGAYLVFHQEVTLGELVSFNVYLGMLIWPMFAFGELMNMMQRGNASLDRVQETLHYKEDVVDPGQPIVVHDPSSIQFDAVSFQYPSSQVNNLEKVTVQLKKGETLGIVGKTGSGKTTFIKQLLRQYPHPEGHLTIGDVDIQEQTKEQILHWIGYVPQDHVLFSRTVRENILFGQPEATEAELEKAIDLASLRKDLATFPDGLHTLVGEKGVALSGGQKQRISIARALIKNPDILILDDSLSAVDAKTEAQIIGNIRSERKKKTTLIASHRLSAVQHADWIVVFENGRVVQAGIHDELIQTEGWYKEQYERQQLQEID